jgi:very-short-patch-repair endonuclease
MRHCGLSGQIVPPESRTPPDRISAEQARLLLRSTKGKGLRLRLPASTGPARTNPRATSARSTFDPQARLAEALRAKLGKDAVQTEVVGLVPGRKYRADIVIAQARLVIEFDGFQYHRSKSAFQKDRERQNLFVAHGWRVLRFFHKQVLDDLPGVVAQVEDIVRGSDGAGQKAP